MTRELPIDVLAGRMVFLVGARRSGTNFLQRLLTCHPSVATIPSETHLFSHGLAPLTEHIHHGPRGSPSTASLHMEREDLLAVLRDLCDRAFSPHLQNRPDAELLVERTPWHVYHLDLITAVYPDARIVHIIRDGRDVARSMMAQPWGPTKPTDIRAAAEEWRDATTGARETASSDRFFEVRYEQLLTDPRTVLTELYRWLGLPVDGERIDEAVAEAGRWFNVDPTAPGLASGKWRTGLTRPEIDDVLDVAGSLLRDLGYTEEFDVVRRRRVPAKARVARWARRIAGLPRRLRGSARQLSRPARAWVRPGAGGQPPTHREASARTVDQLLEVIHTGSVDRLREVTTPEVRVRVVTASSDRTSRGDRGRELLTEATASLHGRRQRRGDVHPGDGTFAVVLSYEADERGPTEDVVVVAHPDPDRVQAVTVYLLPLGQV